MLLRDTILFIHGTTDKESKDKLLLEANGYSVISADLYAADATIGSGIDIVIMSLNNEDIDEQLQKAEEISLMSSIPIVFWSSSSQREIMDKAHAISPYGYALKDDTGISLLSAVRTAFKLIKAEEALQASEERFDELFEMLPFGYQSLDNDGRFVKVNNAWLQALGYYREDIIGKWFGDFLSPDDVQTFRERFQVFKKQGKVHSEFYMLHKNGTRKYIAFDGSIEHHVDGSFKQTHCIIKDETERKQAENALKESEARFSAFLDNLPITAFIKDKEHRIIYVNNEMKKMFSASDWIGKTPYDILPEETAQDLIDADNKSFEQGYGVNEHIVHDRSGRERTWETHVFRIDREKQEPYIGGFSLDITERKRAEEKLQYQRWTFEQILEQSLAGYWDWMLQEGTEYLSPTFKKMFGYEDHELPNSPEAWQKLIFKEDLPRVLDTYNKHVKSLGKTPFYNEVRYRHKDGSTVWVICTGKVIEWDSKGLAVRMIGCHIDITERKQAEEALRKSENLFRKVFDILPIGLWLADKKGTLMQGNPAGVAIWGAGPNVPQDHYGVFKARRLPSGEEIAPDDWALAHTVNKGETIIDELLEIEAFDGKKKIILNYTAPVLDEQGNVQAAIVVNQEITSQYQAIKALEDERTKFSMLLESLPGFINLQAPDYSLRYANRKFIELFGEINERPCYEIFWNRKKPCEDCPTFEVFKTNMPHTWEWSETPNGKIYMIHDFPFKDSEGNLLVLEYGVDITQSKQAEKEQQELQNQLFQAQKIESIGQLAGGIAHDFNNTLSIISGLTELSLMISDEKSPVYKHLKGIDSATDRSAEMVNRLLAYARKQPINPKVIDVNSAISSMISLLNQLVGSRISIDWQPGKDLREVMIDRSQLDQILMNLCVNARDAIDGEGTVTIKTQDISGLEQMQIQSGAKDSSGEYVLINVSDTGCGIESELLNKIFDPFFTTKKEEGTGLGLSTLLGIAKQNHGHISVDSEVGKGTSFRVYLPTAEEAAELTAALDKNKVKELVAKDVIHVVDDEKSVLELLESAITSFGYDVICSDDPLQAIEAFDDNKDDISLLLTDVKMPQMNGVDLAAELIKKKPHLKIIFMSEYGADIISEKLFPSEHFPFLSKPFSLNSLRQKIEELMSR